MGGLIKKLMAFIVIAVIAAVVVLVITCTVLVFIPGESIFGLTFVISNREGNVSGLSNLYLTENLTEINVDSDAYGIIVKTTSDDVLTVKFHNIISGIIRYNKGTDDIGVARVDSTLENGVLNLSVKEPKNFLLFYTKAYIEVLVPSSKISDPTLNVSTGSGKIELRGISETNKLTIGNLDVECNNYRGRLETSNINVVNNLTFTNILGRCVIKEIMPQANVVVNSTLGSLELGDIKSLRVEGDNPYIVCDNIISGTTEEPYSSIALSMVSSNGIVKVLDTVQGSVNIDNSYANLQIKNLYGQLSSQYDIEHQSGNAKISIDKIGFAGDVNRTINVNVRDGYFTANEVYYDINATATAGGSITINNANRNVNITSVTGKVTVEFNKELTINPLLTIISSEGSNIIAKNINGVATIDTNGSGTVEASFRKVVADSTIIQRGSGEVKVYVPLTVSSILYTKGFTGKPIDVSVGLSVVYDSWTPDNIENTLIHYDEGGYKVVKSYLGSANDTTTDNLIITSSGAKIYVRAYEDFE